MLNLLKRLVLRKLEQDWLKEKLSENYVDESMVTAQYMRDQGMLTAYRISFREQSVEVAALPWKWSTRMKQDLLAYGRNCRRKHAARSWSRRRMDSSKVHISRGTG